jgi:uncharacterized membrane protein YeaQ/YmgE (transglycosylase-associated protein family)
MMRLIVWLVVGGAIGWLASMVRDTDRQRGIVLNVIVGIVGAVVVGWVVSPLLGAETMNQSNFSVPGLLVSFLGALILLTVINMVRHGAMR